MSEPTLRRTAWMWSAVSLLAIMLLLTGGLSYLLGGNHTATRIYTTATVIQATADKAMQKHYDTAVAVGVDSTVVAQVPLRLTEVTTSVEATQVRLNATRASHENSLIETRIALDAVRLHERYATESARITMVVAAAKKDDTTQVALAVRETVAALPTSTIIPTNFPPKPQINLLMTGCDTTPIDVYRGEVTNIYVLVDNVGKVDVSGLVVVAKAPDEEQPHQDDHKQVHYLPVGNIIVLRLAVDTQSFKASPITVSLYTKEGAHEVAYIQDCPKINQDFLDNITQIVGLLGPRGQFSKLLQASTILFKQ